MAVGGLEVEIVAGGTEDRAAQRGPWVQNMWLPQGRADWETRPGFGQVAQLDTSLSADPEFAVSEWGYTKHLGSASIRTSWGSEQILSVFVAQVLSGHADAGIASLWTPAYLVSIYDVSTRQKWEEVIFRHTAENKNGPTSMPSWFGHFESYEGTDRQKFVGGISEGFYFHNYGQTLFFGNKFTGLLAYKAPDYRKPRHQTVPSAYEVNYVKGYSESSRVTRVVPVDGLVPESFNYRNETEIPEIVDITSVENRMVLASKTGLFFSDPLVPNAFIDENFAQIPSEREISAVGSINGNVIIFTDKETFLYQVSTGDIVANGRFTLANGSVGCLGPSALVSDGAIIYWADRNGVHASTNGLEVKTLSGPIQPFFIDGTTSPLNNYLTTSGVATPSVDEQPRTLFRMGDDELISLALWPRTGALFVASRDNDIVWCLSQNQWSMWNLESVVSTSGGASKVGVQNRVQKPFVVIANDVLHVIGSMDQESFTGVVPVTPQTIQSNSYYILECGRGGALDRSVKNEDQRYIRSKYNLAYVGGGTPKGRFYIEEPVYDAVTGQYWTVVSMVADDTVPQPTGVLLQFSYDHLAWTLDTSVTLPTERLASSAGFALNFPLLGVAQVHYASVTPLQTAGEQKSPLFILRWTAVSAATTKLRFNITPTIATTTDGVTTLNMDVYAWQFHSGPLNAADNIAQPVDWVYKGAQVGIDSEAQIKSRGLFTRFISHGSASSRLNPNWLWGLFNTLAAPDWKGWTSQIIDFSGQPKALAEIASKTTIRTRFRDALGVLNYRSFNTPSAPPPNSPRYSTPGAPSDNDYLIDDAEYDTISTSDSTRGEHLTYMMFGFLRNRAEKLVLASSKVLLRGNQGGPRRKGR